MTGFFNRIIPNVMDKLPDFFEAIRDTLIMVDGPESLPLYWGCSWELSLR